MDGRFTIYTPTWFAPSATEANDPRWQFTPYAQHRRALRLQFRAKRKQKDSAKVFPCDNEMKTVAIVRGWNLPAPPGSMRTKPHDDAARVVTQESRYASFDPRWEAEFWAWFDEQGFDVVFDWRRDHATGKDQE